MDTEEIRRYVMTFPQVEEGPPVAAARRAVSFKVAGKAFLGVEQGERFITVALDEAYARSVANSQPKAYEEIWRMGKTFAGLRVDLLLVPPDQVRVLIERSWRYKAPKRAVTAFDRHDSL